MKKQLLFITIATAISTQVSAQSTPTWAEDIAPILYENCTKCHNSNGIANMYPLIEYSDAVNLSGIMKYDVTNGIMPPWPPDTSYRRLAHERVLSQEEIDAISEWVDGGTPSGNLSAAPTPPTYSATVQMVNPTVSLQMNTFTVNTATEDLYRCFVIPSGISTDQYITEIEIIPGNRQVVHHVLAYADTASTCVTLDTNDPDEGYLSFGGTGSTTSTLIAGWVPGDAGLVKYPSGMGIKMMANSYVILQIHYPSGITAQDDSTKIVLKLSSGSMREVRLAPILNHSVNITPYPLSIAANTVQSFTEEETIYSDMSILSVAPHMHLLGQSINVYVVTPTSDTIPLINIPDWDFHWQGMYFFQKILKIPSGSTAKSEAVFDNTSNNPDNPSNPPQLVTAGEATTDEMMVTFAAYTPYQTGDENIILDSAIVARVGNMYSNIISTPQFYDPYPSPASDLITVDFYLPEKNNISLEVYDMQGKLIDVPVNEMEFRGGMNTYNFSIKNLPSGIYTVELKSGDIVRTKKIVRE